MQNFKALKFEGDCDKLGAKKFFYKREQNT